MSRSSWLIAAALALPLAALAQEQRTLKAGGEDFVAYMQPMTGGPAKGAVVLVPGDGQFPATSSALARLRVELPAFGWSTWLPVLESPPLTHMMSLKGGAIDPRNVGTGPGVPAEKQGPSPDSAASVPAGTAAGAPSGASSGAAQPAPPGATPASGAASQPTAPASGAAAQPPTTPGGAVSTNDPNAAASTESPSPPPPLLDEQRAKELGEWAERSRARLAATVTAASADGPVVVIAEGAAAVLLTGFAADAPNAAHAVTLIEPVELPGLHPSWPNGYATPVLEVMGLTMLREQGAARRSAASAARLHYYRQAALSDDATAAPGEESLITRRLRGWLKSLESLDVGGTAEAPASTPTPGT
jgi:hypothetical protein